tara:strand:+ start:273 stop:467 length:195 start_codon:yes stop_codon:yes gene_type:complete
MLCSLFTVEATLVSNKETRPALEDTCLGAKMIESRQSVNEFRKPLNRSICDQDDAFLLYSKKRK